MVSIGVSAASGAVAAGCMDGEAQAPSRAAHAAADSRADDRRARGMKVSWLLFDEPTLPCCQNIFKMKILRPVITRRTHGKESIPSGYSLFNTNHYSEA